MTHPKSAALLSFWRRVTTPSSRWERLGRKFGIGHRAAFLLAFGLVFFCIGLGIFLIQSNVRPLPDPLLFHTRLPAPVRVLIWCGTGATAMSFARHKSHQWVGFVALALAPVERILSYAAAIGMAAYPGGPSGSVGTYLTMAVLFGGILFVTRLIASWPDPPGDARKC